MILIHFYYLYAKAYIVTFSQIKPEAFQCVSPAKLQAGFGLVGRSIVRRGECIDFLVPV